MPWRQNELEGDVLTCWKTNISVTFNGGGRLMDTHRGCHVNEEHLKVKSDRHSFDLFKRPLFQVRILMRS